MQSVFEDPREKIATCPRCEQFEMRDPIAANALSRTTREPEDTPVFVCSNCGSSEAMEEFVNGVGNATPQEDWPIVP
jgi:transcription elongation factor Elf1